MSIEELKDKFKINEPSYGNIDMIQLSNVIKYCKVSLELDAKTLDYYFSIDIKALCECDIPSDEIDELVNSGWALNEHKNSLILYVKI